MTQSIVNNAYDFNDFNFKYDSLKTRTENFNEWFQLNRDERQLFGEDVIGRDDALVIFSNLYPENG